MNKYAKFYLEALKTASQPSMLATVFPSFTKVVNTIASTPKKYPQALPSPAPASLSKPIVTLPKEVPEINSQEMIKNLAKPSKIDFK
jgi:hypothetical protein